MPESLPFLSCFDFSDLLFSDLLFSCFPLSVLDFSQLPSSVLLLSDLNFSCLDLAFSDGGASSDLVLNLSSFDFSCLAFSGFEVSAAGESVLLVLSCFLVSSEDLGLSSTMSGMGTQSVPESARLRGWMAKKSTVVFSCSGDSARRRSGEGGVSRLNDRMNFFVLTFIGAERVGLARA